MEKAKLTIKVFGGVVWAAVIISVIALAAFLLPKPAHAVEIPYVLGNVEVKRVPSVSQWVVAPNNRALDKSRPLYKVVDGLLLKTKDRVDAGTVCAGLLKNSTGGKTWRYISPTTASVCAETPPVTRLFMRFTFLSKTWCYWATEDGMSNLPNTWVPAGTLITETTLRPECDVMGISGSVN